MDLVTSSFLKQVIRLVKGVLAALEKYIDKKTDMRQ